MRQMHIYLPCLTNAYLLSRSFGNHQYLSLNVFNRCSHRWAEPVSEIWYQRSDLVWLLFFKNFCFLSFFLLLIYWYILIYIYWYIPLLFHYQSRNVLFGTPLSVLQCTEMVISGWNLPASSRLSLGCFHFYCLSLSIKCRNVPIPQTVGTLLCWALHMRAEQGEEESWCS